MPGGKKSIGTSKPDLTKSLIIAGFHLSGIPCCFHEYTVFSLSVCFVYSDKVIAKRLPPPNNVINDE